ncbi:MAG TPA: SRPBCC family protein [Puia sp.]|jgi:hypothetical protein|nr:SRPBCC family protein [Puia sp.]
MLALYIVLGVIALFLLVAALAGTGWHYEQSVLIQAPADKVWGQISTLRAINQWSPWMDRDPHIKLSYTDKDGAPGAGFSWDSPVKNVGAGSQTILKVADRSEVSTRVDFFRPFKGTGLANFRMSCENAGVRVTWSMKSSLPYPMNIVKVFGGIRRNMGRDFTKGLNKLKSLCES